MLESKSTEQLEGTGRWELSQADNVTTALYSWHFYRRKIEEREKYLPVLQHAAAAGAVLGH